MIEHDLRALIQHHVYPVHPVKIFDRRVSRLSFSNNRLTNNLN